MKISLKEMHEILFHFEVKLSKIVYFNLLIKKNKNCKKTKWPINRYNLRLFFLEYIDYKIDYKNWNL